MSLGARFLLVALLVAAGAAAWWRLTAHYEGRGYTRAMVEVAERAEIQRENNRALTRAAEVRYAGKAEARETFFTKTAPEVSHAAQDLASCPVPADARQLLNDAAACAREDRPASCGAGESLPGSG